MYEVISCVGAVYVDLNDLRKLVCATGREPEDLEEPEEPEESQALAQNQPAQAPQGRGRHTVGSF